METKTKLILGGLGALTIATIIQYKRYRNCVNAIKESSFNSKPPYTSCYDNVLKQGTIDYDSKTGIYKIRVNKFPFYGVLEKNEKTGTISETMILMREPK